MPRHTRPTALPTLPAAVRAHFGLTWAELAAFVGVSQPLLADVEAGREQLGPGPDQRLQVLARQLPQPDWLAPGGPVLPLPPYPLATPDTARDTYWLSGVALHLAATTAPLPPAQAALALARLAGLDAEILAL